MRMWNISGMQVVPAGGSSYVTGLLEAAAPHSQERRWAQGGNGEGDWRIEQPSGTQ